MSLVSSLGVTWLKHNPGLVPVTPHLTVQLVVAAFLFFFVWSHGVDSRQTVRVSLIGLQETNGNALFFIVSKNTYHDTKHDPNFNALLLFLLLCSWNT